MKKSIPFLALCMLMSLCWMACKKNCKHTTCVANATCNEGTCSCNSGFRQDSLGACIQIVLNPCDTHTCAINEHCVTGSCACDSGYTRDANGVCVLAWSLFVGNWAVSEDCSNTLAQNYTVGLTLDTTNNAQIYISNFQRTFANPVVAEISADGTTLTIAHQQPDNDNFFVDGTGVRNGNTITFNYVITDASVSPAATVDSCNASIWTK